MEKIDGSIREIFKKKLKESALKIRAFQTMRFLTCQTAKIKLANVGYRLVYRVDNDTVFVNVTAIGKREHKKVYDSAKSRL